MRPIIAVPATIALVVRAYKKKSLTTGGIIAAALTAAAHAYHPWNLPFALLVIFFLAGTRVTHVKEQIKATLTLRSTGSSGGEGPRTHVQVLANSLVASVLTILHARQLRARSSAYIDENTVNPENSMCYSWGGDILLVGIIANYAAVAADTFSSELGILSTGEPRLITSWTLRKVPRGTNGGVSLTGLLAGFFGSMIIVASSVMFIPFCTEHTAPTLGGGWPWTMMQRREFMGFLIIWGFLGSVLDSFLGGLFQRSVRDVRSGKIVEGDGGHRVLVTPGGQSIMRAEAKAIVENAGTVKDESALEEKEGAKATGSGDKHRKSSFGDEKPSRVVESGWDLLDNNDVNFLMAVTMSISAMAVASWHWGVSVNEILAI